MTPRIDMGPTGTPTTAVTRKPPVPEGIYLCRLASIKKGFKTRNDDEMWKLGFVIIEGEYKDRWINDRIIFSERAQPRLLKMLGRMGIGFPTANFDLNPEHLRGRIVHVETEIKSFIRRENNEEGYYNGVPYDGYHDASDSEIKEYQRGPIPDPMTDLPGDRGQM